MARRRRQPEGRWTEQGGVWRKNGTESLTKMVHGKKMILNMAMHKMKRQGDRSRWSAVRGDGDGWKGGSQVDRKTTKRVYAGGNDTEGVEDGPDKADMEEERGCAWPRKVQGHHTTQPSTETVGEGSRRKNHKKRRRCMTSGKNGKGSGRRDELQTGCTSGGTRQYLSGVRRPGKSFWHSTQRDGDDDATVDGSTISGHEDGWGHVREDNSNSGGGRRRMADDRLPKRAAELREQGRRRRGRPRLIWEDWEMWRRQEGRETGRRRQETEGVEKTSRWGGEKVIAGSTSPLTKGKRGRERFWIQSITIIYMFAAYCDWHSSPSHSQTV